MIHNPGNTHKIETLYAWVSVDSNGNEGIIASRIGEMAWPLVFSQIKMAETLRELAEKSTKGTGLEARLISFQRISK